MYDLNGALLSSRDITLTPLRRFDVQTGWADPGPGFIGSVEVVPANPDSPYLAQLYYYGSDNSIANNSATFSYAAGENTQGGISYRTYVPVSTQGDALNFLVVTNTDDVPQEVRAWFIFTNLQGILVEFV